MCHKGTKPHCGSGIWSRRKWLQIFIPYQDRIIDFHLIQRKDYRFSSHIKEGSKIFMSNKKRKNTVGIVTITSIQNVYKVEYVFNPLSTSLMCKQDLNLVIIMSAGVLAPNGAMSSAGKMMTEKYNIDVFFWVSLSVNNLVPPKVENWITCSETSS